HSAYNPVERSMASLLTKLAGIVLPVNKHSTYLDSQSKDNIFGKLVITEYVDIENVKKCNDIKYCSSKQCEKAASLLASNDSFLPSLVIEKDSHYINSIHLLEYLDKPKILG
ncbi:1821_t:CDS:2, partial [Scutellospora calospora]